MKRIGRILKWALLSIAVVGIVMLAFRSYRAFNGPPLRPWHTFVPHELSADQLDVADWNRYLAQEDEIMASVRAEVSQKLAPDERLPINRYFEASPVYPEHFARNWNRSLIQFTKSCGRLWMASGHFTWHSERLCLLQRRRFSRLSICRARFAEFAASF